MLDKLATDVRGGFSGSLVFTGEPGVGKTRLLQYMAGSATDATIVWIVGAQSELRLGFAALHRLVHALSQSPGQAGRPALQCAGGDLRSHRGAAAEPTSGEPGRIGAAV